MKIELRTRARMLIGEHGKLMEERSPGMRHDALAAHAYQAAFAEALNDKILHKADWTADWIEARAAELLASYLDEGKL